MEKKIIGIFVVMLILSSSLPIVMGNYKDRYLIIDESLTFTFTSNSSFNFIQKTGGQCINMNGFSNLCDPGNPHLPLMEYKILVRPDIDWSSLKLSVESVETNKLLGLYEIAPSGPLVTTNNEMTFWGYGKQIENNKNIIIYNSNQKYPEQPVEVSSHSQMRKWQFIILNFYPFQYNPVLKQLYKNNRITINISYERTGCGLDDSFKQDHVMDDIASEIFYNYEDGREWYKGISPSNLDTYDYVIITRSQHENSLLSFKKWKEKLGYSVKIVDVAWIYQNYNGIDYQEQIRNFLIDKYIEWGIKYVLIVGNPYSIPMRICDPMPGGGSCGEDIYSDFYYAELTSNWNKDGDAYWGEYEDDGVDFFAEVYVGRIPANNKDDVKKILQKIIDYEQDNGSWKKNVLLLGAILQYAKQDNYQWIKQDGAALLEMIWNDFLSNNGYTKTSMYEAGGLDPSDYSYDYALSEYNVLSKMRQGYGIVNWIAHGYRTGAVRFVWDYDDGNGIPEKNKNELNYYDFISASDSTSLNDDKPSIVFAFSCNTAYVFDSIGTSFLINGAVAYIGATHTSLISTGWQNPGRGCMHDINYYFMEKFIMLEQSCSEALFNVYKQIGDAAHIINIFTLILYGDPSLHLFQSSYENHAPDKPNRPTGKPSGKVGEEHSYTTTTNDQNDDQLLFKWSWGDGNESEWLGPYNSGETVEASYSWESEGDYEIRVKAKDEFGKESEWSDPLSITMPKSKPYINTPILNFLENHPLIYQLLQRLFNI